MTPRGWKDSVKRTWLGRPQLRAQLDEKIRAWLGRHRNLHGKVLESVSPFTIDTAYADVLALGTNNCWFWCTTAIALTGELLLCSQRGGTFANLDRQWSRRHDQDAWINIEALRLIRNATCHPAHHSANESGTPAVQQLVEHIRNFDQEAALVSAIEAGWSTLRRRDFAEFALRKLDAVGIHFGARHRIEMTPYKTY